MSTIRIPERVWDSIYTHLFRTPGEHFAFMQARWTYSRGEPIFMAREAILVPDDTIKLTKQGWELTTDEIIRVINTTVHSGDALIEVHNHGGIQPRFSPTDRAGLREFPAYVLDSLPGRPYAATVWGDSTIYGEFFLPDGRAGRINSITVNGSRLQQVISREDDTEPIAVTFDRQLLWFSPEGQRMLGWLKVAIVGAGGTGSPVLQNLVYLGIRNFVIIDDDEADETSMNRLVIATAADLGTPKAILGRRFIKSVAPDATVTVIESTVQSPKALDTLKGVDIIFGCVDNDAARLILNECALAYSIPYFDLAVGIDAKDGTVSIAGGRVAIVRSGGPCLYCMGEIDAEEARFFLSRAEEQRNQLALGYIRGMDINAPSVAPLNAAIAAAAINEFAVFVSGLRSVNVYSELDLLGTGRSVKSQWLTPTHMASDSGCVQCALANMGDGVNIERYTTT